uniref:DUF885 domain-containing protein n=1 Tax=uncultured Sphingomonas sp. TaxID=158754 RepID=UPI0025CEBAA0|nr:DUF885 domain-containing protein [uncultured Sphingomonas sp.]
MNAPALSRRQAVAALASSAALPLLTGCARTLAGAPATSAAGPMTEQYAVGHLNAMAEQLLALQPETATSLGVDNGERAPLRAMLTDRSPEGQRRIADSLRMNLERVDGLDTSGLTHSTRTSIEVVRSAYRTALEGFALPYGDVAVGGWRNTPYVVIQNVGAYLDVPRFLDSEHQVKNAADAEALLLRLAQYPRTLDGELERARAAREKGLVPPAFLLEKALGQMNQSLKGATASGSLVEMVRTKTKGIPGDWVPRAQRIVTGEVAPALQRQIAELEHQRAVANNAAGMWARPNGPEYYRWALKASTTTNMTPDEVHQLGLDVLKQLHGRMDPLLRQLGYTGGTVGARMKALADDPKYKFSEGDKGRAEIMAFIQERLRIIRAQMPRAFNTLTRGNVEVKRLPPEEEPGAPAAYGGAGSIDGSIPGKFWINLRTTDLHSKYSLPDLTHHEAIPGHVWQGEYAQKLPLIRSILAFNAYSEGWALYAEQLADELGVFDADPAGRLGYLQSIAFRAIRLIVDTGLHAKRWTRQQAVQYFVDVNGSNPLEVASEVDRYCSWPAQALGYEVGHQEINRQRERAKAALGARYDLKAFNDTVVLGGNVPLDVLAKNVDEYVRGARG